MAIIRTKFQWGLWLGFLVLLFVLPALITSSWLLFINNLMITLIAVIGLQLLVGYCGQISLMQSASMAVGAYTATILAVQLNLPFWLTVPLGTLGAGIVGIIFGVPSLRVKGYYLALATLGAHYIITFAIAHGPQEITAGKTGLNVPSATIGGFTLGNDITWYYFILVITLAAGLFAKFLTRGKFGRAFIAIRDNDLTAEAVGINLFRYKVLAFFICSLYAGLAGALVAYYVGFVVIEQFTFWNGIWYLGMIIIGGAGSILGAVFGAVLFRFIEQLILLAGPILTPILGGTIFPLLNAIYALLVIVFLIFEPRGLVNRWEIFKASYRLWPYTY